ncbi:unnamed protein product [Closterium sp. NIES-54]
MADYIVKVQTIHGELKELSIIFLEQAPAAALLVGLTSAYKVTRKMLLTSSAKDLTFAKVSSALLFAEKDSTAQAKAYALRAPVPQASVASAPFQRNRFPACTYVDKYGNRKGHVCGGTNHPLATCFKKKDDEWYAIHGVDKKPPNWMHPRKANLVEVQDPALASASDSALADVHINLFPGTAMINEASSQYIGSSQAPQYIEFTLDSGATHTVLKETLSFKPYATPIPFLGADSSVTTFAKGSSTVPCPAFPSGSVTGIFSNPTVLYHHQLRHPNFRTLADMASKKLLLGLPASLPPPPDSPAPTCLDCTKIKLRQQPHPASPSVAAAPLDLVHMDVWDPAPIAARGGHRYFLLIVDDHTKAEAPEAIMAWVNQAHTTFGTKVKRLHSDGGGEFCNTKLETFCSFLGILQNFTLPDSPQQNGIAESRNHTLVQITRCLLSHSHAPLSAGIRPLPCRPPLQFVSPPASPRHHPHHALARENTHYSPPSRLGGCSSTGTCHSMLSDHSDSSCWGDVPSTLLEDRHEVPCDLHAVIPQLSHIFPDITASPSLNFSENPTIPIPLIVQEARSGPHAAEWRAAMEAECEAFARNHSFDDETPPPGVNIVGGKWLFRVKQLPDEAPMFKARYVAKGFTQQQYFDFFKTFSPTSKPPTVRTLLDETVFMDRPEGFPGEFPPNTVWKLNPPVYGLKQASSEWHNKVKEVLLSLDFHPSSADPTLFIHRHSEPFYILIYVDEFILVAKDSAQMIFVQAALSKALLMKDLGDLKHYLGMEITHDHEARTISLSQEFYINNVLKRFEMELCTPMATPLPLQHLLTAPAVPTPEACSEPYPELVGSLMYAMMCTRPDLAYPVTVLSRYVAPGRFTELQWSAAKWRSTRSSSVSLSSCETELYVGTMVAHEARWLTFLLQELGYPQPTPTLWCDNKSTIHLSQDPLYHTRTKHIELRHFFIRDLVQREQLNVDYVASDCNLADLFTKPLGKVPHHRLLGTMGLWSNPEVGAGGVEGGGAGCVGLKEKPLLSNPFFLNPFFLNLFFLKPFFLNPFFLNPFFLNPFFLNPFFLHPFFLNPFFLNPFFLHPFFLNPFFLNPFFLNPFFLNPFFLHPFFLHPFFLNPFFLNPFFLNPFFHLPLNPPHAQGAMRRCVQAALKEGAMRRRVLSGLKEVGQAVRSGRAKCVVLAPNVEEVPGAGGLDAALTSILSDAATRSIPVVVALSRRRLAKVSAGVECGGLWCCQVAHACMLPSPPLLSLHAPLSSPLELPCSPLELACSPLELACSPLLLPLSGLELPALPGECHGHFERQWAVPAPQCPHPLLNSCPSPVTPHFITSLSIHPHQALNRPRCRVSAVAILDDNGAHRLLKSMLAEAERGRKLWQEGQAGQDGREGQEAVGA